MAAEKLTKQIAEHEGEFARAARAEEPGISKIEKYVRKKCTEIEAPALGALLIEVAGKMGFSLKNEITKR